MLILFISLIVSFVNILLSREFSLIEKCIQNDGVAFGIRVEYEAYISILVIITLIVLGIISKKNIKYFLFSISLLGLSNFIVRILHNGICDYISVLGLSFNVVDVSLVVICIYVGLQILFLEREK